MSCFHLFWPENAGWTGAFGAGGAAFWEPGKFVAEEERKVENQIQIQIQCKQIQILGTWEACCRGGQGGEAGLLLLDLLVDGDSKDLTTSGFTYLQFFRWNKTQLCYIFKLSLSMSMRHPPKSLTLTRKFNSPKKKV